MDCPHELTYLYWDEVTTYVDADYLDEHFIYRISRGRNPIDIPEGRANALSCKWSLLIREEDILLTDIPPLGNAFKSLVVSDLRAYKKIREKEDEDNKGWHKLTCVLQYSPLKCDCSHTEILIKHEIFDDEKETNEPAFLMIYTHKDWEHRKGLLNHKTNKFFKQLRKDYRLEMIDLFL